MKAKPDWWSEKYYTVLKALEAFGPVRDRQMLDKIVYFADLKKRMFAYMWAPYGICSFDLLLWMDEHARYLFNEGDQTEGTEHDLTLSAHGSDLLDGECYEEIDSAVKWTRDLMDGMSFRQMNLLASVHFIAQPGQTPNQVHETILGIAQAADFTVDDVGWAMTTLSEGSA